MFSPAFALKIEQTVQRPMFNTAAYELAMHKLQEDLRFDWRAATSLLGTLTTISILFFGMAAEFALPNRLWVQEVAAALWLFWAAAVAIVLVREMLRVRRAMRAFQRLQREWLELEAPSSLDDHRRLRVPPR